MINYFIKRLIYMVIVLLLVSIASFYIVNLPPGSWIESYAIELDNSGEMVDEAELLYLTERYGLDQPIHIQYIKWIVPILFEGDFGQSFEWQKPVWSLIKERLLLTMIISFTSLLFIYLVSIPIALYSATHQYSILDYMFTFIGLIGLAIPNFLLALKNLSLPFLTISSKAFFCDLVLLGIGNLPPDSPLTVGFVTSEYCLRVL